MKNVRKEIAERLKFEFSRRGLSLGSASKLINIPVTILNSYIDGKREVNFDEISKICDSLNINSVRLLFSENYPKSSLNNPKN